MTVYLDCNATTPVEPAVLEIVVRCLRDEYGNAGSRTHGFGVRAKQLVERAREQVAAVVDAAPDEVIFTSGATESNNLAILGLREFGVTAGRRHVVSTQIEHKAVVEPLEELARLGFEITLVPPTSGGFIDPEAIANAIRPDTLLVSVMHVNNETGVMQAIDVIAAHLQDSDALFHVDAAQGFGKELAPLTNRRVNMISISGHKIYAPKGVGALICRRQPKGRLPIAPVMFGGGQERGLRPGTLPVALIAGLGEAARLSVADHAARSAQWLQEKTKALSAVGGIDSTINGDVQRTVSTTLNVSFSGVDSEAAIIALKDIAAVSNGSACTSSSYRPSHVLSAMKLPKKRIDGAIRFSWSHLTPRIPWERICAQVARLQG